MRVSDELKIKHISDRVSIAVKHFSEKDESKIFWSLVIIPFIDKMKMIALLLWIIAWTVCGVSIMANYKIISGEKQKLFIVIFSFFWIYYEWKIVSVLIWKKWGKEKVWVKDDSLYIEETGWMKNKLKKNRIADIHEITIEASNEKVFSDFLSNSFWNKGKPRIKVNVLGKNYYFGYQLLDKEAREIVRELMRFLKK